MCKTSSAEMIKDQETASPFFLIHVINLAKEELQEYTVNATLDKKLKRREIVKLHKFIKTLWLKEWVQVVTLADSGNELLTIKLMEIQAIDSLWPLFWLFCPTVRGSSGFLKISTTTTSKKRRLLTEMNRKFPEWTRKKNLKKWESKKRIAELRI